LGVLAGWSKLFSKLGGRVVAWQTMKSRKRSQIAPDFLETNQFLVTFQIRNSFFAKPIAFVVMRLGD